MHRYPRRTVRALAVLMALSLTAVALASSQVGAAPGRTTARSSAAERVAVYPVSKLRRGMKGTGLTVIEGKKIEKLRFKILGVQDNGIAPGIDLIVVRGYGALMNKTSGFAAGMSGSPMYIDGRLVGALAYGFSAGDFKVGGVTPGGAMMDLLDYPTKTIERNWARNIDLSRRMYRVVSRSAGGDGQMRQLALPFAISGISAQRLALLQRSFDHARLPYLAYSGGSAAAPGSGSGSHPLLPGSVYSAMLSYGDVTAAAIGTTTATVGDRTVAFGHPFNFTGPTSLGVSGGSVFTVVKDRFSPFKFAIPGAPYGSLTQDRLAGIVGRRGPLPKLTAVRSSIRNDDLNISRKGLTKVASKFEFLPDLAAFSILPQLDRAFDRIGGGSAEFTWVVKGKKANGERFTFRRSNLFDSDFDISFESIFEVLGNVFTIHDNPFAKVTLTDISFNGSMTQKHRRFEIEQVSVTSTSSPDPVTEGTVFAQPGDTLTIEVRLRPDGGDTKTRTLQLLVPEFVSGSMSLSVLGGGGFFFDEFLFDEPANGTANSEPTTFQQLLDQLKDAAHNNDLVAELSFFFDGGDGTSGSEVLDSKKVSLNKLVQGEAFFEVFVEEPCPPEGCEPPPCDPEFEVCPEPTP